MFKILEKQTLAPKVEMMVIQAPYIARHAKVGNFIVLRLNKKGERIPLTIADSDRDKGTITILFQRVGKTTESLGMLNAGDKIQDVVGPLGHATPIEIYGNCVLVAGGIGAATLYPIIKALKAINTSHGVIKDKENVIARSPETPACRQTGRDDEAIPKDEIALLEPALSEKDEILRGVYPEQKDEILRFAQNDMRRAQNDRSEGARNDRKMAFSEQSYNHITVIMGARTKELLIWEDKFRQFADECFVTTDDGSYGRKGLVTDVLKEVVESKSIALAVAVGPVRMMKAVSELTKPYAVKTIVSLNPLMVEGTGMCGACRVKIAGETRFACIDGPEFDGHDVDFQELESRLRFYKEEEEQALHLFLTRTKRQVTSNG
ncbi:MAG: sulfide/dihydroorotate dehydrogenase-like FAD/NAD-binding protein [Thermodesulfovibrionia bacterium]|nr:sulfide/dihydroorotate dehydrogenase-like FAD/NAD-binding protein [Thermodesulfovibrionia bacterium]